MIRVRVRNIRPNQTSKNNLFVPDSHKLFFFAITDNLLCCYILNLLMFRISFNLFIVVTRGQHYEEVIKDDNRQTKIYYYNV